MAKRSRKRKRPTIIQAPRGYRVFVSHATADKWIARTLCEKIESTGATTFRDDRDIDAGDDIPESIRIELGRSNELVVLLTPESLDRHWVLTEVGAFWGVHKDARIVAILCHVKFRSIPELIRSRKAISINDLDSYLLELAGRVESSRK